MAVSFWCEGGGFGGAKQPRLADRCLSTRDVDPRKAIWRMGGGLWLKHEDIVHGFVLDLLFFFVHILREHGPICL